MRNYFIASILMLLSHMTATAQQIDLSRLPWQFKNATDKEWLPATVPGTVHTDLLANKKIPDPNYRNNEKDLQWIDKADWEYRTQFNASKSLMNNDRVELIFNGLDTYADVWLNGEMILQADNMFRSWKLEVKTLLKSNNNELRIYFHSPINKVMAAYDNLGYTVPVSNNDQSEKRVSVFTRKAGFHYGWDWGPRFVTSGIWRTVTLSGWSNAVIEDLFIKQRSLSSQKAMLEAQVTVNAVAEGLQTIEIITTDDRRLLAKQQVLLYKGDNNLNIPFQLEKPERWWPNGMGSQKLYHFSVQLKDATGKQIAQKQVKRGLRTIELVQDSDAQGRSFYFKVNDKPVFMKGANYIPQDNFLPRVTRERYRHILQSAAESHMNMLRVWGGGIYQDDIFYELCDEKGILVWQDFMFACALLPPFEHLKRNIYHEAVENVKRLRNHASVALWCGNNEVVQFFNSGFWGQVKETWTNPADSSALFDMYKEIFHHILPAAVKACDDEKPYWSSSPAADNFSMEFKPDRMTGDQHYWGVWGGKDPIEAYNTHVPRFMSEYGFQSFPDLNTVKQFADSTDYNINSAVMTSHQRSNRGNAGILEYMKDWFVIPADFSKFLYVGQLLQSEAIKTAMEAHRRAKPFCMGSLFWQIDDCWPAASWSSIDYFGRWKALQYQARRSFATIMISTVEEKDSIRIYIVSDSLKPLAGELFVQLIGFDGAALCHWNKKVTLNANESKQVFTIGRNECINRHDPGKILLHTTLKNSSGELAANNYYFRKPKELALPNAAISYKIEKQGSNYEVTLSSSQLARFVTLSVGEGNIIFSDNYFDLLPGKPRKISFSSTLSPDQVKNLFTVISLKDSIHE